LTRAYDKDYKGIEFVGDYRLTKNIFWLPKLEMKTKLLMIPTKFYNKRVVSKKGFDYNAYENWLDMENIISIGLRYGFSTFNQGLI
jgi:hypothetical protein